MSESVQLGTIQIALPATSAIAGFDKRFQVLDLPFLFKSRESAFKALDGELGKKLDSYLAPLGFANLGYFENGFRHVTNSRKPVYTPADMKGLTLTRNVFRETLRLFPPVGCRGQVFSDSPIRGGL